MKVCHCAVELSLNKKLKIFSGVSCDICMKNNFRGLRYKCLVCYDFDLCAQCFEAGGSGQSHTPDHPMQCIVARGDFGKRLSNMFCFI